MPAGGGVGRVDEAGASGVGWVLLQTPRGEAAGPKVPVQMLKQTCWVSEFLEFLVPWPTSKAEAEVWPQDPLLTVSCFSSFSRCLHTHTHMHPTYRIP